MITQYLFSFLIMIAKVIFGWLPIVTELPWGIDEIFVTAIQTFKGVMGYFPPLEVVLGAFLIYAGFRLGLIVLKIFLAHRAPHHD